MNSPGSGKLKLPGAVFVCAVAMLLSCGGGGGGPYLVGAHYYVWYPSNFEQGYLRAVLEPPEAPALGEYSSRSAAIAAEQISLAASHGIDFFTLD